jgi:metallophosphoesterase (TIGR00282 family)
VRVLFIGDIVGRPGRAVVGRFLRGLRQELAPGLVVANAENAAGGFGITAGVAEELLALGIDLLTSGNHVWDKKEAQGVLARERRLLRPANYPEGVPGVGVALWGPTDPRVGVVNLQGRVFMPATDCPFRVGLGIVETLRETTPLILVDFHAEATSEKAALAWYLDGKISALVGTHTHVQTADEQILPGGTAYLTDVGMTGARDSVIGMEKDDAIRRFLTALPTRFRTALGPPQLNAVLLDLDDESGRAKSILRIQR